MVEYCNVNALSELVDNHIIKCRYENQADVKASKDEVLDVSFLRKLYMIRGGNLSIRKLTCSNIIGLQKVTPLLIRIARSKL